MASNEELVSSIKQGNFAQLLDLWEQNTGLIYRFARKYSIAGINAGLTMEDLAQVGYIALHTAALAYDPAVGAPFSALLARYLKGYMLRASGWKHNGFPPSVASLDAPTSDDSDGETQLDMLEDDAAQAPFEAVTDQACAPFLKAAINRLPDDERDAVWAVYYEGAAQTNISRPFQRGMRKLRNDRMLRASLEGYITPIWKHTTLTAFKRDMTSSVEWAAIRREALRERLEE